MNLKELAAKVEAGEAEQFSLYSKGKCLWRDSLGRNADRAFMSYHGSLDAAKALHDAVLPGWGWVWASWGQGHISPKEAKYSRLAQSATNDCPARAWLLAILRALIAEQEKSPT